MIDNNIALSKSNIEVNLNDFNFSSIENYVSEFENKISVCLDLAKVVCLSSGTSALHLALVLAGVKKDDEVLCQTSTFAATVFSILYQKATPVFIDSENETWNMCPLVLEKAILDRISKGNKPKAIIFVNLYGMPAKIEEIVAVSKKYNITLIEDAAESLGSTYKGKKCGTFGDYGVLSFNKNKIITTFGGGALISKNEKDKEKAIFLANQAKDKFPYYQHSEVGFNYRMNDLAAFYGIKELPKLDENIIRRRKNNLFYQNLFKGIKDVKVFKEFSEDYFSNHWLSAVLIDGNKAGFSREDLRLQLLEDNIESRPLWKPMHMQPIFKDCKFYGSNISENLFRDGLCLPSGSNLTESDLQRISKSINKLL